MSDTSAKTIPADGVLPQALMEFTYALERTESSRQVWDLLVELYQSLGIDTLDYVIATDFQNWQKVQFIRTTLPSDWIDFANSDTRVRRKSTFRLHSVNRLFAVLVGYDYLKDAADIDPDRLDLLKRQAERFGTKAGMAIPLRMSDPGQAAHLCLSVFGDRAHFEAIMARHGWTLHASALSAHTRHMELFKSEFSTRNKLTDKQVEIIKLVGAGFADKEIAEALGISFSTVRQRISALQTKTGCKNRAELAALAMRMGLIADPMNKVHDHRDLTVFLCTGDDKTGVEYDRSVMS